MKRPLCTRLGSHLWLWPWQVTQRCVLCGAMKNLHVGEQSITLSPAGVGDVARWSGSQAAAAAGDIGMDTSTGRGELYLAALSASKKMACLDDVVGGFGVQLITSTTIKPYSTIGAALAVASAGDIVSVGPGTWNESVTVPAGVTLRGSGFGTVINGSAATGTRVALGGNGSAVENMEIQLPTNATYGVFGSPGGTDQNSVRGIRLVGNGASGIGIRGQAGAMFIEDTFFASGTADIFIQLSGSSPLVTAVLTYVLSGTIKTAWDVGPGCTLVAETLGIQLGCTVTNGIQISNGTINAGRAVFLACVNGISVINNDAQVVVNSGRIDASSYAVLVGSGYLGGLMHLIALDFDENKISAPGSWWNTADIVWFYQNEGEADQGLYSYGKLRVGQPERPRSSAFGGGSTLSRGETVLTTDSTASGVSDGGNLTDVSAAARSPSSSTFTFQGTAQNHTILFGSTLQDGAGVIKHWAHLYNSTTASTTDGVYQFEIWNGSAWVEVEMLVDQEENVYRYADNPFIRANAEEYVELRLSEGVTWATKTINGTNAYWSRVRIMTAPTTAPVFERWRLSPSHAVINAKGNFVVHGLARWKETISAGGNVYGETGGVVSVSVAVGSGGIPTGWNQNIKNSNMNSNGDAITYQFSLPRGICTACPLMFRVYYSVDPGGGSADLIFSCLPLEVSGVSVADPTGGATPTARTAANTETLTAKAAQTLGPTGVPSVVTNKLHAMDFIGFDIDDYYEGDMVAIRLELDDDGSTNNNVAIWAIEVIGVKFTFGEPL